jgi:hypothetical protein
MSRAPATDFPCHCPPPPSPSFSLLSSLVVIVVVVLPHHFVVIPHCRPLLWCVVRWCDRGDNVAVGYVTS